MQPLSDSSVFSPWQPGIFSLSVYGILILVLLAVLLFLTEWLGHRRPGAEKQRPYESGIIPTGAARLRYPVPFFMVAVFFLLFDLEGAFIFSWAIAAKPLGWAGWLQITFFIFVLLLGLAYIWLKGGLAWGPTTHKK
ncbi:MAG: NADH-quinone oxidoreductase subunit A [Desulfosarcinaceae bacterium]|nr:NADH-quinone oxidoreductase subunit A [Desulfosarcinaceae bacterium]